MFTPRLATAARGCAALAALLVVGAPSARAQVPASATPAFAQIDGRVIDSVHSRPVAGAVVTAVRMAPEPTQFHAVMADRDGRFRFDSLDAGSYAVTFTSGMLDSLELVLPERMLVVAAGSHQTVDLAIPSSFTLRAAACPGLAMPADRGAVVGTVRDAATDRPLQGATVVVGWTDLSIDRATMRPVSQPRTGAVVSDSLGHYRLCGVPTNTGLALQVQQGTAAGSPVDAMVDDSTRLMVRNLSFSLADTVTEVATTAAKSTSAPAARGPAASGTATLTGVVLGTGDRPVPDVQVHVVNARGVARSDSIGRFTLGDLPAGSQMIEAHRIGYTAERVPVELRGGQTVTQDVHLAHVVSLDSIRIIAQRTRYPEFEKHRRNAFGRFYDEAAILRRNPYQTSDLFRAMTGFRVSSNGGENVLVSSRGATSLSRRECAVNVIVDGMQHMDIDQVPPDEIAAIEAYPGVVGVPMEYASSSPCGAVLIWTKR